MAFLEDLVAGHDVDCKGGDDADPTSISASAPTSNGVVLICVPCWTIAHSDT